MYRVSIHAFAAAALVAALGLSSAAAAQECPSGVTAVGKAEISARPDVAYVTFAVVTEDKDAAAAARANAARISAVIEAIVDFGIARTAIETTGYSVQPIMDYKKSPPVTVGYRVSNQVRVKLRDLGKIGGLIDTAIGAGANAVQGVRFDLEEDADLRRQALATAAQEATRNANAIADSLGIKLGKVMAASESGGVVPPPVVFGAARAEAVETPILPGEIQVTATVTVVYAIL